jgi:hypothetical protein
MLALGSGFFPSTHLVYRSMSLSKKLFLYLAKDPASVDVQPVPDEALSEVSLCLQHGLEHSSLYDNPGKATHYYME